MLYNKNNSWTILNSLVKFKNVEFKKTSSGSQEVI